MRDGVNAGQVFSPRKPCVGMFVFVKEVVLSDRKATVVIFSSILCIWMNSGSLVIDVLKRSQCCKTSEHRVYCHE